LTKRQIILFSIPAIIWGSTWYAIKFQLGNVDPLVSVSYRFILAGLILFGICVVTGKKMKFSLHEHFLMFLLGLSLFGLNYWFVYKAETALTSGVVAVIFSLIIFFNIFFNVILLKGKIKKDVDDLYKIHLISIDNLIEADRDAYKGPDQVLEGYLPQLLFDFDDQVTEHDAGNRAEPGIQGAAEHLADDEVTGYRGD